MAAGNLDTDNAITVKLGTAMQSRLVHLQLEVSLSDWVDWARQNGIDHRIISYLQFEPNQLHNFDSNHSDKTFSCPRTWSMLSNIIKPFKAITSDKMPILAGTVGVGAGSAFKTFTEVYAQLPTSKEIISNPTTAIVPTEPSANFAVAGLLSETCKPENVEAILTYMERLDKEFQFITIQNIIAHYPSILSTAKGTSWMSNNADFLS